MGSDNLTLMEISTVTGIVFKHIKGSQLPPTWRKKLPADSNETYRITVQPESEVDEDGFPKEELFREEFVAAVEQSCQEHREGKTKVYRAKNSQETATLFDQWVNE